MRLKRAVSDAESKYFVSFANIDIVGEYICNHYLNTPNSSFPIATIAMILLVLGARRLEPVNSTELASAVDQAIVGSGAQVPAFIGSALKTVPPAGNQMINNNIASVTMLPVDRMTALEYVRSLAFQNGLTALRKYAQENSIGLTNVAQDEFVNPSIAMQVTSEAFSEERSSTLPTKYRLAVYDKQYSASELIELMAEGKTLSKVSSANPPLEKFVGGMINGKPGLTYIHTSVDTSIQNSTMARSFLFPIFEVANSPGEFTNLTCQFKVGSFSYLKGISEWTQLVKHSCSLISIESAKPQKGGPVVFGGVFQPRVEVPVPAAGYNPADVSQELAQLDRGLQERRYEEGDLSSLPYILKPKGLPRNTGLQGSGLIPRPVSPSGKQGRGNRGRN